MNQPQEIIVDWPECDDHNHTYADAIAEARVRMLREGRQGLIYDAIRSGRDTFRMRVWHMAIR